MDNFKMPHRWHLITSCCRIVGLLAFVAAIGAAAAAETRDDDAPSPDKKHPGFVNALKNGKLAVNLRYRFEYVNDQAPALTGKDARASTLRTSFRYRSQSFRGFAGFVEFENVSVLGENSFNNKGAGHLFNGVSNRPVVADTKLTEVNQVYLNLTAIPDTVIHAGREEVILDNHRFLGHVGWRQNHQSF
ncbi:MAG: hypothetical protein P8Y80_10620, partial [Acidobacteriota bacterium]